MGGIAGGGGKSGGGGGSGNSQFDVAAIMQALGENIGMITSRYSQLGLGIPEFGGAQGPMTGPGGIGAQAAAAGGNLTAVPGMNTTAENTDITGLQQAAQAALGQLQNQNQSNAGIPGTTANQLQNIATANQQNENSQFAAGANTPSGIPSGPST